MYELMNQSESEQKTKSIRKSTNIPIQKQATYYSQRNTLCNMENRSFHNHDIRIVQRSLTFDILKNANNNNWNEIANKISTCGPIELEIIYSKKTNLINNKDQLSDSGFATIVSYLITRKIERTNFSGNAFNNLIENLKKQLNNKSVAENLIDQEVIIIGKNEELTDNSHYSQWKNASSTGGTGSWRTTRGAGAYAIPSATDKPDGKMPAGASPFKYTAIGEETLDSSLTSSFTKYDAGYSVGAHEFAHTIHEFGITDDQRIRILNCYNNFCNSIGKEWVDGPQYISGKGPCYASTNVKEYFAQSSNAYWDLNGGTDATTGGNRHNGSTWLSQNDPDMLQLLNEIYNETK